MDVPPNKRTTIDTFHRERSKCVDSFAEVEQAVIDLLRTCNVKVGNEPFSAKLLELRKVSPSCYISKVSVAKLPPLLNECFEIAGLRNDIVHSKLKIAIVDGEHKACFVNLLEHDKPSQEARLMNLQGLRDVSLQMTKLADELKGLLSQGPIALRPVKEQSDK